jgi:iron complex transport system ATP-binding protein
MEILAKDVVVGHGATVVLSGVDLTLRPGELVGLIGPNGAGKTTLLRVLAGLAQPLAGSVLYDGQPGARLGARTVAKRLAYLAQGGEVNWSLSAWNLVMLGRLPHRGRFGGPSAADREAVARAFASADAGHLADRTVAHLSGGERARVLLARALAVEGEMLLADEPVAALDPLHQLQTLELLRNAAMSGLGVTVVLHDLALAARFCDRLVLLAGGAVARDDRPENVLTDEVLAAAYRIRVARAEYEGQPVLLPWRPLRAETLSERHHAPT